MKSYLVPYIAQNSQERRYGYMVVDVGGDGDFSASTLSNTANLIASECGCPPSGVVITGIFPLAPTKE